MSDLYENLLKATDNTNDITNEKYGTITKAYNNLYGVIEKDTNLEHSNVPSLNSVKLSVGDTVAIGFINNSIYNPIILGSLGKEKNTDTDLDIDLEMDLMSNGYLKISAELIKGG